MTVYILNIILCYVICQIGKSKSAYTGINTKKYTKTALILVYFLWVCLYTFRYKVGADSWSFNLLFEFFVQTDYRFIDMLFLRRDWLFSVVEYISVKVLGFNRLGMYAMMGALTYGPVLAVFADQDSYRENFDLSFVVLLYIGTMAFYSGYNGSRQAIATAFSMYAYYKYLRKGKIRGYIVYTFVAFGFHSAVLFAIPFQLISMKRMNSIIVKSSFFVLLVTCVFLPQVWDGVVSVLELFGQAKMARDYSNFSAKGSNVFRTLVAIAPIAIGFVYFRKLKEKNKEFESDLILSAFSAIFMLFSFRSAIFARVSGIIGVSNVFLISQLKYTTRQQKIGKFLILTLYFVYMILLLLDGDGHYYPYQFLPNINATWV